MVWGRERVGKRAEIVGNGAENCLGNVGNGRVIVWNVLEDVREMVGDGVGERTGWKTC